MYTVAVSIAFSVKMQKVLKETCKLCSLSRLGAFGPAPISVSVRWRRPEYMRHALGELYKRRLDAGPEPERPRSVWSNWNYDSELYCFGKRLGEEFKEKTIRTAFTYSSYLIKEAEELEFDTDIPIQIEGTSEGNDHNEELMTQGAKVLNKFVKAYLRHHFPRMPEECICNIHSCLTSNKMLSYIALNIGIKDLILVDEFPPSESTMAGTFKAVVGALAHDQGVSRAEKFIQDFVMTQLIGKDINEYLGIVNPMGLLATLLEKQGKGEPEPRLIHSSGSCTVLSVYMVGIYSDKQLIGKSYGETVIIAEEMAARDALRNIFNTTLHREPLVYKQTLTLDPQCYEPNYSLPQHFQQTRLQQKSV